MTFPQYYREITDSDGNKTYVSDTNLPSPSELRNKWCFGLALDKLDGGSMTDEDMYTFLIAAVKDVERKLGVLLKPTVIVSDPDTRGLVKGVDFELEESPYDYEAKKYANWGFLQLRQRHVRSLEGFKMVLPNGMVIIDFKGREEWIKLYKQTGQVHIVPYAGDPTLFALLGGNQSGYPFVTGQINANLPQMFYVDYTAGFGLYEIPEDIRNVVAKTAAIDALGIAGDAYLAGISSQSTSIDGLSESFSTSASATSGTYTSHILQMQKEIDAFFDSKKGGARSAYRGITMTGL